MFGLRTTHGETLFVTISPNRRHSALLLKLSRARKNDTSLTSKGEAATWRRRLAGADVPCLTVPNNVEPEAVEKILELPPLRVRQQLNAHDPLSSTQRYDVATRVLMGRITGMRICMRCPHCNNENAEKGGRLGSLQRVASVSPEDRTR